MSVSSVHCWRCQAQLPPRRSSCWRCGAQQDLDPEDPAEFPRRLDADGEFCDDPGCDECDDDWDDWDDDGTDDGPFDSSHHPSRIGQGTWGAEHAALMHPAARTGVPRVGLLPRLFADFLSMVIWWIVVVLGFFLALALYDSPPVMLVIGLMAVPLVGETALTAEFGVTPGKYLVGLRVRAEEVSPGWSRSIIRTFVLVSPFLPMVFRGPVGDIAFIVGSLWLAVVMVSIAVDPQHRGIHDRIAGTVVVAKVGVRTT